VAVERKLAAAHIRRPWATVRSGRWPRRACAMAGLALWPVFRPGRNRRPLRSRDSGDLRSPGPAGSETRAERWLPSPPRTTSRLAYHQRHSQRPIRPKLPGRPTSEHATRHSATSGHRIRRILDSSRSENGSFSARVTRDGFLGRSIAPWKLRCVGQSTHAQTTARRIGQTVVRMTVRRTICSEPKVPEVDVTCARKDQ
jgi:hypothetical protein